MVPTELGDQRCQLDSLLEAETGRRGGSDPPVSNWPGGRGAARADRPRTHLRAARRRPGSSRRSSPRSVARPRCGQRRNRPTRRPPRTCSPRTVRDHRRPDLHRVGPRRPVRPRWLARHQPPRSDTAASTGRSCSSRPRKAGTTRIRCIGPGPGPTSQLLAYSKVSEHSTRAGSHRVVAARQRPLDIAPVDASLFCLTTSR